MDAYPLRLFTWVVRKSGPEKSVVMPVCPQHPDAPVRVETGSKHRAAVCSFGGTHVLNVCLKEEFDREQDEAWRVLASTEWWAAYRRTHT